MSNNEREPSQVKTNELFAKDYSNYRQFVDSGCNSSRKQGLFSEESYAKALADQRSLIIQNHTGLLIPVLTPIDIVPGMNTSYFEKNYPEGVFLFSTAGLDSTEQEWAVRYISENISSAQPIFYEYSEHNPDNLHNITKLQQLLAQKNIKYTVNDFSISGEESKSIPEHLKQGSMIMYSGQIRLNKYSKKHNGSKSLYDSFIHGVDNGDIVLDKQEGSEIINGGELKNNRQLLSAMWSVYKQRLSEISVNYPINLEDSFEEFVEMVADDDTVIVLAYEKGEVACFTYLLKNIQKATWLNDKNLQKFISEDKDLYYFPGIVAHRDRSGKALEVLNALAKACRQTNIEFDILFECTNHSAVYIPHLIAKAADITGYIQAATKPEEQIYYNILQIND